MHKWAEALTLGVNCKKKEIPQKSATICLIIFSIATPLGILLGHLLNGLDEIVGAVFMSLSVGTFVYLGIAEILFEEFSLTKNKYLKSVGFTLGFLQALILKMIDPD